MGRVKALGRVRALGRISALGRVSRIGATRRAGRLDGDHLRAARIDGHAQHAPKIIACALQVERSLGDRRTDRIEAHRLHDLGDVLRRKRPNRNDGSRNVLRRGRSSCGQQPGKAKSDEPKSDEPQSDEPHGKPPTRRETLRQ